MMALRKHIICIPILSHASWGRVGGINSQALIGAAAGFLLVMALAFTGWVLVKKGVFSGSSKPDQSATMPKLNEAEIILGETMREQGLHHVSFGDSKVIATNRLGDDCVQLKIPGEKYIYFTLDPSRKLSSNLDALIWVEFLAPYSGRFDVQYDGYKFGASPSSRYSDTPVGIHFDGASYWHCVALDIKNARLEGRQNGGADFRLRVSCPEFYVRRVALTSIAPAQEPSLPGDSSIRTTTQGVLPFER